MVQRTQSILTNIIKIILFIIPPVWGLYIVWKYGVDIFYMDEWDFFDHYVNSPLNLEMLWEQHNEHRMLFPQLLTYVVGSTFRWSSKALMYTSVVICFILYILTIIIYMKEKETKHISVMDAVMFFVLGSVIFNACQWENLLWGFQTAWFMIITCVAGSFLLYDKYLRSGISFFLITAMLLAIIASFSSLHGLIIWIAYVILLLAGKLNGEKINKAGFWTPIVVGIGCFCLYFYDFHSVSMHEDLYATNTDDLLSYFFAQIGATLLAEKYSLGYMLSFIIFLISMVLFSLVVLKKEILTKVVYFGPVFSAYGMILSIALGRSNYTSYVPSRYTTNSTLLLVCFVLLSVSYLCNSYKGKTRSEAAGNRLISDIEELLKKALLVLSAIIPLLVVARNLGCIQELENEFENRIHAYIQLVNYEDVTSGELGCINHVWASKGTDADEIEDIKSKYFSYLKKHNWNAFSENYDDYLYKKKDDSYSEISGEAKNAPSEIISMQHLAISENKLIISLAIKDISEKIKLKEKDLKKYRYYVAIGDDIYAMVMDGDYIRFSKDIDSIPDGYNKIHVLINENGDASQLIRSNPMICHKADHMVNIYEYNQESYSILDRYEKSNEEDKFWIDYIDYDRLSDESEIELNKETEHVISGWTYVEDEENSQSYLKIGDVLYKMDWVARPDVVYTYRDSAYSGFEGRFLPYNLDTGEYDIEIVVIDYDNGTYTENRFGKVHIEDLEIE